jgi:hypothetical protein
MYMDLLKNSGGICYAHHKASGLALGAAACIYVIGLHGTVDLRRGTGRQAYTRSNIAGHA